MKECILWKCKSLIPHPSSLIPHPSSLIPHPSSLIPHGGIRQVLKEVKCFFHHVLSSYKIAFISFTLPQQPLSAFLTTIFRIPYDMGRETQRFALVLSEKTHCTISCIGIFKGHMLSGGKRVVLYFVDLAGLSGQK